MGKIYHDWNKIKHDYISDPQSSLRRIAAKYHISLNSLALKSKADGWYEARKKYQDDLLTKALTKTAEKQSTLLSQESDYLAMMKGHLERMLRDEQQFHRHLVQESSYSTEEGAVTTTEERIFDKVDARALKDTMQVLRMVEDMTRSLYNLQKADAIQRRQIEEARLELERQRFEFEKQKAEFSRPDKENVISIEGIEKGWTE